MTVIIGAICEVDNKTQTGSIVLCADQLITYFSNGTPITSNKFGSKLLDLPAGFWCAYSDDVSRSHHVYTFLHKKMTDMGITPDDSRIVDKVKLALQHTGEYIREWMRHEVLGSHDITVDEWLHDAELAERTQIQDEISEAVINSQMIVAGFGSNGVPVLYFTNCMGNPQEGIMPGFFCGGNGGTAALMWLNMRGQNSAMSRQRTAYHVLEAKQFALQAPGVGNTNTTLFLSHGKTPVNISDVSKTERWWKELAPKDTKILESDEAREHFTKSYFSGPNEL